MRHFIILAFLLLLPIAVFAQKSVSGKVTDEQGSGIPGVNIYVKGTTTGTISDIDGNYSIEVPDEESILVFSYVGYVKQEIPVRDKSEINVSMKSDPTELEDVIVVGYGTQKKSLVTGAIAKVEGSEIAKTSSLRAEQAIQGRTSGIMVAQESGSPGAGMTVRIRGTGSNEGADPLYIVDGMRTGGIEFLNPNDIASIEVLKDAASAAIYGAEGANGVVLITTKTGSKEQEGTITYDYYYGMQQVSHSFDVLSAPLYTEYSREAIAWETEMAIRKLVPDIPQDFIDRRIQRSYEKKEFMEPDSVPYNTDWLGEIFQPAPMQSHQITASGGNDKSTYLISGSYYNQDGIVGGADARFTRYTARFNGDHEVNNWLSLGSRINFTHFTRRDINENNEFGGVIGNAISLDPLTPLYYDDISEIPEVYKGNEGYVQDENGYFGMSTRVRNEIRNPVAQMHIDHSKWTTDKLLGGVYADFNLFKGFTFKSKFDIDLAYGTNDDWIPVYYFHSSSEREISEVNKEIQRWRTWQLENYFTYEGNIGDHNYTLLGGMSNREYYYTNLFGKKEDMIEESDNYAYIDFATSDTTKNASGGGVDENRLLSYFTRGTYSYADKYILNATLRADGSSLFGPDNKFGYFPSLSLGWVVSRENFWDIDLMNYLKIRASWGQNGSLSNLSPFQYVSLISYEGRNYLSGNDQLIKAAEPEAISNPGLQWETSEQTDVGLDISLLDNRITFALDYFSKITKDLLFEGGVPDYAGNSAPWVNAGNVKNSGLEVELGLRKKTGDFNYDLKLNVSKLHNEVVSAPEFLAGANLGTSGAITRFDEGYPVWYFYGYETNGMFQDTAQISNHTNAEGKQLQPSAIPGDVIFVDNNGLDSLGNSTGKPDGTINEADKKYIGSPHPDWTFGVTMNLYYKNFDFSMFIQGILGNELYNGVHRTDLVTNNKPEYFYDERWTPDNPTNEWFRATYSDANRNFRPSDLFVEDGSYLRMKNIQLGYTLPDNMLNFAKVKKLRIYISAQNVFLLTNYRGMDPEIGATQGANSIGVDRGFYPKSRTFMGGISLTL